MPAKSQKINMLLMIFLITAISGFYLIDNLYFGTVVSGIGRLTLLFEVLALGYIFWNSKVMKRLSPIAINIMLFGLIMQISILVNNDGAVEDLLNQIVNAGYWLLAFLYAYVWVRKNNSIMFCVNFFAISFLLIFYLYIEITKVTYLSLTAVNFVYFVILMLPLLLMLHNTTFKLLALSMMFGAVVLSFKRAGMLALMFGILAHFFIEYYISNRNRRVQILLLSLLVAMLIAGGMWDSSNSEMGSFWDSRMETIISDGGSGRFDIWEETILLQMNSDIAGWIVGHGYSRVYLDSQLSQSAHNDFMEILYDYGIFALILYLNIYRYLFTYFKAMCIKKVKLAAPFGVSIVMFIMLSVVSHLVIYPTYFVYLSFFWGAALAKFDNENS